MRRHSAILPTVVLLVALLSWLLPAPAGAQGTQAELERLREDVARLQSRMEGSVQGEEVYQAACATCHGFDGGGQGPESDGFAQHATDFTKGIYKLRSTLGEIPAPGDLERTIREGMSGTEMVPFKHVLSESSIAAVAAYIRTFSESLADPDVKPDPDDVVKIPAERPYPRTEQTVAEGKELYEEFFDCADCHGEAGRGSKDETDDWDFPVVMVSFQNGYFKSGNTDQDLYRTIATGMLGTTMGAYVDETDTPEDLWKVVDYIRSLERSGSLMDYLFRQRPSGFDYRGY